MSCRYRLLLTLPTSLRRTRRQARRGRARYPVHQNQQPRHRQIQGLAQLVSTSRLTHYRLETTRKNRRYANVPPRAIPNQSQPWPSSPMTRFLSPRILPHPHPCIHGVSTRPLPRLRSAQTLPRRASNLSIPTPGLSSISTPLQWARAAGMQPAQYVSRQCPPLWQPTIARYCHSRIGRSYPLRCDSDGGPPRSIIQVKTIVANAGPFQSLR